MAIRPGVLEREALAQLLEHLAALVRIGDSLEGNIAWELGAGPPDPNDPDPLPQPGPGELLVHGCWRVGNRVGQGGMQFMGAIRTDPRHGWTAHGHPCCGEAKVGDNRTGGERARCGRVGGCKECTAARDRLHGA